MVQHGDSTEWESVLWLVMDLKRKQRTAGVRGRSARNDSLRNTVFLCCLAKDQGGQDCAIESAMGMMGKEVLRERQEGSDTDRSRDGPYDK